MSTQSIKALVLQFYDEVVNQGDREAADRLLAPGFIEHGDPPKNREAFKQFLASLAGAFPDIHLEVADLLVEGDKAAARVKVTGTHEGTFLGNPGTGRVAAWSGVDVFKFEGDRISDRWNFRDLLGLFDQLGFLANPVIPYLSIRGAARAIEFYKHGFGALEVSRMEDGTGRVTHAELKIGGARIYLAEEHPEIDFNSPVALGGSPVLLDLNIPEADAFFERATAAGAKVLRPMAGQGGGIRNGKLVDPYGHTWMISTTTSAEGEANG
jgi:PhnB protein